MSGKRTEKKNQNRRERVKSEMDREKEGRELGPGEVIFLLVEIKSSLGA